MKLFRWCKLYFCEAWIHHKTFKLKEYGEKSVRRNFCTAKIPYGENSVRRKLRTAKVPYGENSYGENSVRRKIRTAKSPTAKIPTAKIPTAKIPTANIPATVWTPKVIQKFKSSFRSWAAWQLHMTRHLLETLLMSPSSFGKVRHSPITHLSWMQFVVYA